MCSAAAVAVRIRDVGHRGVRDGIVQQPARLCYVLGSVPTRRGGSRGQHLGPLGGLAQHEDRDVQAGRPPLEAARVGQDEPAALHQVDGVR